MKEHKHAAVLRAIADGVPLSEFELHKCGWEEGEWYSMSSGAYAGWFYSPESWEVRRKQQFITVNGFKVPKPLEEMPTVGAMWLAFPHIEEYTHVYSVDGQDWKKLAVMRGLCHRTKEAAVAHAKAMLGIDPGLSTEEQPVRSLRATQKG